MTAKDHQDLLDLIVSIARSHIGTEFLCADLSRGSGNGAARTPSAPPTDPFAPTAPFIPLTGQESTVEPGDREWWKHQDQNMDWIRQWEDCELDEQDPQDWK